MIWILFARLKLLKHILSSFQAVLQAVGKGSSALKGMCAKYDYDLFFIKIISGNIFLNQNRFTFKCNFPYHNLFLVHHNIRRLAFFHWWITHFFFLGYGGRFLMLTYHKPFFDHVFHIQDFGSDRFRRLDVVF